MSDDLTKADFAALASDMFRTLDAEKDVLSSRRGLLDGVSAGECALEEDRVFTHAAARKYLARRLR